MIMSDLNKSDEKKDSVIGIEDKIFPLTFMVLKIAGFWTPSRINLGPYICYKIYSTISFFIYAMVLVSLICKTIFSTENSLLTLVETWYMIVPFFDGLLKSINILSRREKIISIMQKYIIEDRWSVPRDENEKSILKKYQQSESNVLQIWFAMIVVNGFINVLSPIIRENPDNSLMFESYSPCNRNVTSCFWLSYVHQCWGYLIGSFTHVGWDCLIFNFMDRVCAHFEIFEHRLLKMPSLIKAHAEDEPNTLDYEKNYIKQCVYDHWSIYKTVEEINRVFYVIVSIQFVLTISVLCLNIYLLSKQELFSPQFISIFTYLCCLLVQHFFYCWQGYKLSEKSAGVVYKVFSMNWMTLHKETKKLLLIIMLSSSHTLTIFNSAVVSLTPEMFLQMVKIAYSSFNLLRESIKR